jgi:ribonuclease G
VPHSAAPAPVAESTEPPLILPGESLRKYRGAGVSPEAAPVHSREEHHTVIAPPEPASHAESHAESSKDRPAAGHALEEANGHAAEPVAEHIMAAATEPEPVVMYDQPARFPLDNAVPDAPIHHPVPEPEQYTPELERREGPPPLPSFAAASEEANPRTGFLDEDEDRDIQAMILDEIEGLDDGSDAEADAAQLLAESGEENEEEGPRDPGVEASPVEGGQPASAQVRERSGRMPHRMGGRRMRRRGGRGGDRPDNRGEARTGEARSEEPRPEGGEPPHREREKMVSRPTSGQPLITDLLKEGQEIIVQIAKEPLGQKGARITSHIALPGRYVVFMPTLEHMGVSRKIASDEERHRLKKILQGRRPGTGGGFITRTAAEGRTEEEIAQDMEFLYKLWQDIKNKAERKPAPLLLHHDLNIVERILRDQLTDSFKAIWIDNEDVYEHVLSFVQRFQPALVAKVKMYTREAPIFDAFSVTSELEKALRPKVWLKSGGYIVINQTEALVAIDINTGKFVGKSNRLEDTIVKTNTEAIKEIVRQIRLRDLGGIIVIDFIDMDERKNRQKVMQALEEAMRVDRAPYKILQFNDFGLVAITRKRVKQSLERTLCAPCPHCDGAGYIKSVQTVVSEILTEARKLSSSIEGKDVMLRVHPDVAKVLKSNQNKYLEELEETLRRPVLVKSDPLLHHEKFDLA